MSENCPICQGVLKDKPIPASEAKGFGYECVRCGNFCLPHHTKDDLRRIFIDAEAKGEKEEKVAVLSHAICNMQRKGETWPTLEGDLIKAILKNPLPSINEQANNFIRWLGENVRHGEDVLIEASTHQAIMGALKPSGFAFIIKHLFDTGIVTGQRYADRISKAHVSLSYEGWQYYDKLKRGAVDSRKAFMAMEYGDSQLDKIVEEHFKPAVACTGFELYRLDQKPKAGLIDDRLRVEIRTSRFLISDLTHENPGAYWEAGYAEGLGKPVIYTCSKKKFDEEKPHFDTNHHLTIIWNEKEIQKAVESLKATIRATLPNEAKMSDY
jgi:hypothetical protein